MEILLALSLWAIIALAVWLLARGVVDAVLDIAQREEHERFWGDGHTKDGSWAGTLRGKWGPAVEENGQIAITPKMAREIHPRDSLGRHLDPSRVRIGKPPPGTRKGIRLAGGPEAL